MTPDDLLRYVRMHVTGGSPGETITTPENATRIQSITIRDMVPILAGNRKARRRDAALYRRRRAA